MVDKVPELGLAEAIGALRAELRMAQDSGQGDDVRFSVGPVEVELAVEIIKKAGGDASVKVLSVLSLGGAGEVSKGETNRVRVTLNPIGVGGAAFEVAAMRDHRPDLPETPGGGLGSSGESQQSEAAVPLGRSAVR
jgi:hypothetical protein